jgi:hypothetical protein
MKVEMKCNKHEDLQSGRRDRDEAGYLISGIRGQRHPSIFWVFERVYLQKSERNCELNICEIYINGLMKLRNMKVNGRGHRRVFLDERLCFIDLLSPTV